MLLIKLIDYQQIANLGLKRIMRTVNFVWS